MRRPVALRDPVVAAFGLAVVIGLTQAATFAPAGRTMAATVPFVAALTVAVVVRRMGPRSTAAGEARAWLAGIALGGGALAVWLVIAFLVALPDGIGQPTGFYLVKVAVTSPLGEHNTAAGLLLVAIVAAAALASSDRRWLAVLAVGSVGAIATLSRGAAVVLCVVAIAAWVVASTRRVALSLTVAAAAVLVGVLLAGMLLDASPPVDVSPAEGALGESLVARADLAVRGLEVGLDQPLAGVGLGGFVDHATDLPLPHEHAHQLLAHAFAEGGVFLLGVAVLVPCVMFVRGMRLATSPLRDLVLLGGAGLILHAQMEILGGRLGYETLLALVAGLAGLRHGRGAVPSSA